MDNTKSDSIKRNEEEGIQVICAGLGRTGSLSLSEALQTLGYNPMHYVDARHHQAWAELAQGKRSVDSVIDLVVHDGGYNAVLDNPACDIYQNLLKRFPSAKVILTVRDNPQAFVRSWKTLFDTMVITEQKFSWSFPSFFGYIPLFSSLYQVRQYMGTTHLGLPPGALTHKWRDMGEADSNAWLEEQYERHNQHVKDHVPPEQLLVFNVKEGWEPLCRFLEKEVPSFAFPHATVNSTEGLLKLQQAFLMVVYGWIPTLAALALGTYFASSQWKNARPSKRYM